MFTAECEQPKTIAVHFARAMLDQDPSPDLMVIADSSVEITHHDQFVSVIYCLQDCRKIGVKFILAFFSCNESGRVCANNSHVVGFFQGNPERH